LAIDSFRLRRESNAPADVHTVFVFDLPFSIPVPDGIYQTKIGTHVAEIAIKRIQREEVGGLKGIGTLQMMFDKYGKSSFSHIDLKLPWKIDFSEIGRKPLLLNAPPRGRAKEIALRYLNRFIEVVRYVTEEYWVEPVRYQDILSYESFYWDGKNRYPAGLHLLDSGIGGFRVGGGHPFQMGKEKIEKLNDILKNELEIDSSKIFILNAKDSCLEEDFRLAVIETVTALEIVLYKFIRLQGQRLKIENEELEGFIKDVGLTGNISVVLRMLTKNLEQIDVETVRKCRGMIKIRNKILHEGLREIGSTDTEERIVAAERMIAYLGRLIAQIE
jgi:hypothetical protein